MNPLQKKPITNKHESRTKQNKKKQINMNPLQNKTKQKQINMKLLQNKTNK